MGHKYLNIFYDFDVVNEYRRNVSNKKDKGIKPHTKTGVISGTNKHIIDGSKQQLQFAR
jgi:hypothetical protein